MSTNLENLKIVLNGQPVNLPLACSLQSALMAHKHNQSHCAVALNKTFIPKSRYAEVILQEGDVVEVLAPMQGG